MNQTATTTITKNMTRRIIISLTTTSILFSSIIIKIQAYSPQLYHTVHPTESSSSLLLQDVVGIAKTIKTRPTTNNNHSPKSSSSSSSSQVVSFERLQQLEAVYQNSGILLLNDVEQKVTITSSSSTITPTTKRKTKKRTTTTTTTTSSLTAAAAGAASSLAARRTIVSNKDPINTNNNPNIHNNNNNNNNQNHHQRRVKKMYRPVSQHSRVVKGEKQLSAAFVSSSSFTSSSNNNNEKKKCLTHQEEIEYAFQLRTFRAALNLRDSLVKQHSSGMFVHPTEMEWAIAAGTTVSELRRVVEEGQEARCILVAANIGLVTSQAKKFYHITKQSMEANGGVGTILTLPDLIQEGNLGLMEAAERYQPEKGFRFSTYATWWIRQRIGKCVAETSRIIRLPSHIHSMLQKIRRVKNELQSANNGKEPTLEELSHCLDIPIDKLKKYTKSSRNVVSLESPLRTSSFKATEDSRTTIGDTLASDGLTPYEDAEVNYLRRDIQIVMDNVLQDNEREIIIQRFGLFDNHTPRSVAETAAYLNISTDRVRLVEARALNKLRHPQRNHLLKEYIISNYNNNHSSSSSSTTASSNSNIIPTSADTTKTTATSKSRNNNNSKNIRVDLSTSSSSSIGNSNNSNNMNQQPASSSSSLSSQPAGDRIWFF